MLKTLVKETLAETKLFEPIHHSYLRLFNYSEWDKLRGIREFYRSLIRPSDLVFDVGANIGKYSRIFLGLGAKVIAVDPVPQCLVALKKIKSERLIIEGFAISDKPGLGTVHVSKELICSTLSSEWLDVAKKSERFETMDWKEDVSVPITTLDSLMEKHGVPDFLKLDVEGFEEKALDGMSKTPRLLSFEFNSEWMEAGFACINKPCFSERSRFNYVIGEPYYKPALSGWVGKERMIEIMDKELRKLQMFCDIVVRTE